MGIHTQGQPTPSDIYQLTTHHEYGHQQPLFPPMHNIVLCASEMVVSLLGDHKYVY